MRVRVFEILPQTADAQRNTASDVTPCLATVGFGDGGAKCDLCVWQE